ncbi:MAG: ABC transporter ATP-binding protein/permease [Lachnospiraceae bacterium]|nr:ABC transporter ATP-binding protein/permease [Lachnospiraceae bacterium]
MIKLNHLDKFFNKNKSNEIHVINDISIDFPDHGMIALFGRSGCGKTTLLNVIGGLDKANGGSVFIEGQEMSAKKDELRNKYIGYIFQNYCLSMNDTCFDNVAASLRLCGMRDEEEIQRRVMTALTAVGMQTYFKRTPNSLSGGQQQRIAIARAIVKNPQIILADEPTGNLDEANTVTIMNILKDISKDHLVLLVTHEANLVDYYCDSVIELSDGQIVGTRNNEDASGYRAKDKNTIYLGEYERSEINSDAVAIDYYGEKPSEPVKVRLINRNGVMYLKVDSPGVHVLDESSEVHIEEGIFEAGTVVNPDEVKMALDLSQLPPVEGSNYGKLFSLKDGIKSGFRQITDRFKKKKSAKWLRRVMVFFAIVVVFYIAYSGSPIRRLKELKNEFNQKAVFAIFTTGNVDEKTAAELVNLTNVPESGAERVTLNKYTNYGRIRFNFAIGSFETYRLSLLSSNGSNLSLEVNVRPKEDAKAKFLCSLGDGDGAYDIFLSATAADNLLKSPPYDFINDYEDLLGMICDGRLVYAKDSYERALKEKEEAEKNKDSGEDENSDIEYDPYYDDPYYDGSMYYDDYYYGSGRNEKENVFRVAGIIDTDEFVVYVDESFFNPYSVITMSNYIRENGDGDFSVPFMSCVVYSNDVAKTKEYMQAHYAAEIKDWEDLCKEDITEANAALYSSIISILVMVGILSLCMYFIMKSVYMVRMKEFGIYRAIGVSKKNLLYRSFVETAVMTTLSVFVGYLIATAAISYIVSSSKSAAQYFYYPLWMKLLVLVFLFAVCLFSGTISVRKVLRKTPAEILAKYDI